MPLSRLRPGKADELKRRRRHSIIVSPVRHNSDIVESSGPQRPDLQSHAQPSSLLGSPNQPSSSKRAVQKDKGQLASNLGGIPPASQRFSFLSRHHVSDPQISKTARAQASAVVPALPPAPSIVTTAPTDAEEATRSTIEGLLEASDYQNVHTKQSLSSPPSKRSLRGPNGERGLNASKSKEVSTNARESRITLDEPGKARGLTSPPAYGDVSNTSLALPISRLSDSSRSDASSGDHIYATTTTQTVSTTTTFFKLPRRKKNKGPLFPLPLKIPPSELSQSAGLTPRDSTGERTLASRPPSPSRTQAQTSTTQLQQMVGSSGLQSPLHSSSHPPTTSFRRDSTTSAPSHSISPVRTSTHGFSNAKPSRASMRLPPNEEPLPTPPLPQSGRTSSSIGRPSLGGLFSISRLRQNSEPRSSRSSTNHPPPPGTPISSCAKSQSFTLCREPILIPEREEGDTPARYLVRLEETVSRGAVATVLSRSNDEFLKNVLRSYMRGFKFFGDPLDMSIRKLLMVAELPKETQQIDRVIQAFANRYHECNPGVFASPDEAYFIAFSILILHTDVFNKNNRNKMQKHDYTKNTRGQGVADEILECFYDNISYTPFIRVEDDLDINGERIVSAKPRKSLFTKQSTDSTGRPSREPVDPYTIILDNKLDSLRPSLRDVMNLDDHYTYQGRGLPCNFAHQHKSFYRYGSIQILSSRSRPEAFMSPETVANPAEAHPGVVDIKVTKAGILWRKEPKKKKTRSPWQEWGAILTGTQLYFFRNSGWVKSLMHQHESQTKRARGHSIVFKPPLEQFKPDVLMSTEDAVALQDTSYKKHKNAFVFVRHGGLEEVFLADTESEVNDWLSKLNYAAALRTAGVRIRGSVESTQDAQKKLAVSRIDSGRTTRSSETSFAENTPLESASDESLTRQIQAARRQVLAQKIKEADERLEVLQDLLDLQLRNARHLQLLAPIQNRTREQVVLAAGGMAAKIKWTRIDIWRSKSYRNILAYELEDVTGSSLQTAPSSRSRSVSKGKRDNYVRSAQIEQPAHSDARPATQPSPARRSSMDDVFKSLRTVAATTTHKPKGSWELPPLSFQPTRSSLKSSHGLADSHASPPTLGSSTSLRSVRASPNAFNISNLAVKLAAPGSENDLNEQAVLKNAGVCEIDSPSSKARKRPETPGDEAEHSNLISPEHDIGEGKGKARRSFQRTLRDSTHSAGHHRNKRGRDSGSSSVGLGENSLSKTESDVLARSAGSFTVHGKKASVVNLGSEWQALSPDERLRKPREGKDEDSKLHLRLNVREDDSARPNREGRPRPTSTATFSTNTTEAAPFEEAAEELPLDDRFEGERGVSGKVPEMQIDQ